MQSNTLYILNMQRLDIYYNSRCELRVNQIKRKYSNIQVHTLYTKQLIKKLSS